MDNKLLEFFKNRFFWLLFAGTLLLIFGYFDIIPNEFNNIKEIFKIIGTASLSGGFFMFLTKSKIFTDIFKEELRKVIYAEEHLSKRKDLEDIWENVTQELCNKKFKDISSKLQKNVKDYYLPLNHEYYYKDYKLDVDFEYDTENEGYIIVNEDHSVIVVAEDDKEFIYRFKSTIPFPEDEQNKLTNIELIELKVNDKLIPYNIGIEMKMKRSSNILFSDFKYNCGDIKKEYHITRTIKKRYDLKSNPDYGMLAVWLYQNFSLNLNYPKNMDIKLLDYGVLGSWVPRLVTTAYGKKLKANYKGLIFRNQGFLILHNKL